MARRGWNDSWNRYAESVPLRTDGGIATYALCRHDQGRDADHNPMEKDR